MNNALLYTTLLATLFSCDIGKETPVENTTVDTALDQIDADGDGYFSDEDCDDADAASNPGAVEVCDGLDNNCDGFVDEGVLTEFYFDNDGDGFGDETDWIEACDALDGYVPNGNDCDDEDALSYPSAPERCDSVDNDCDGDIDEDVLLDWYLDEDGDGFGSDYMIEACDPPSSYVASNDDCDDENPDAFPENDEVCDEADNDCDGDIDEGLTILVFVDQDNDGFGDESSLVEVCELEEGYSLAGGDCDDIDTSVNPDADEVCEDGMDNNCDGFTDEPTAVDAVEWYLDNDGDGFGDPTSSQIACDPPVNHVGNTDDCNDTDDTIFPSAPELCDGLVNACGASLPSDEMDDDGDGYVECTLDSDGWDGATIAGGEDCDDANPTLFPAQQWYVDLDGDGYGDPAVAITACAQPSNMVLDNTDCNDASASSFPGQTWYIDNDGDGFGNPNNPVTSCTPPSNGVLDNTDCDDADSNSFPGQTWHYDLDGDTFGNPASYINACAQPANTVLDNTDCDDGNNTNFPGQTWYIDSDGDGFGDATNTLTACLPPNNATLDNSDCNDTDATYFPGQTWYTDGDGDGFGDAASTTTSCLPPTNGLLDSTDCDDNDSSVYPNAPELCDGVVNACNTGLPGDEIDNDGDGFVECSIDNGGWKGSSISGGDDCNDGNFSINPSALELVGDGVDSDCNGGEICILDADDDGHGNENGLTTPSTDSDCSDAFEAMASNVDDCDDSDPLYNPTLGCWGLDCEDILNNGWGSQSGVYTIDPDGSGGNAPYDVYCDMQTDGGGWTRITHLHSNRSIGSIKRDAPFFSAAWQQNNSSYNNTSNSSLVLDNNTYGMLDSTDFLQNATNIRLTCNDNTRNLSARAIWTPSSTQLNTWLAEGTDQNEYLSTPYTVSLSKNGGSFNNANVYFSHTENAFFGSWHVCGRLSATSGGFQLGFCHNSPSTGDSGYSNVNQIMLGYHTGFNGLRLECTRDTPNPTTNIDGNLSIWIR